MAVTQETVAQEKAKHLRIKVTDTLKEGHHVVNIRVPIGLVRWGMKMGEAFSPEMKNAHVDWDSVIALINEGEQGKLVEVEDEAEHKLIEVSVE